jgi:hypothetical protein
MNTVKTIFENKISMKELVRKAREIKSTERNFIANISCPNAFVGLPHAKTSL